MKERLLFLGIVAVLHQSPCHMEVAKSEQLREEIR